ncbi:peptidoglycan-binding protein [Streptomyces sp. MSC1_001]|jgi:peptidoglycan hydrolase-like protein with peptidoglycan-binding domain|uniref:peptidoglycan-binding protein n=1 Tax=Streptomyces sp. MSC1_001 TaxID=2909263 RepID=UPI00203082AF|nr:peptidoglycan-binding protein [Streptomyces sp. MSC1_001]
MSRRTLAAVLVAIAAVVGGGAAVAHGGGALTALGTPEKKQAAADTGLPPATVPITRGDLSDSSQEDGTLDHLGERKINGALNGTLNWIAPIGSDIQRDERLYEVNGRPVRLMYGAEPMYRTLKAGDEGRDVRQVEENLAALGYTGFTVDDAYSEKTAAAVKRWQKAHDLKQTGTLGPDAIAFAGSAVRVKRLGAATGDQVAPGQPVLTVTGSERVVRFKLTAADAVRARTGTRVSVELPDGRRAPGKVSSVGRTATTGDDPQDRTPKIDLTVSFDAPEKIKGVDQAPVVVHLTGATRRNVLSVPVSSLLALPGGGFGVQVVENGTTRDVEVELGMFGQGRVEISGSGLREGMKVGVPSA